MLNIKIKKVPKTCKRATKFKRFPKDTATEEGSGEIRWKAPTPEGEDARWKTAVEGFGETRRKHLRQSQKYAIVVEGNHSLNKNLYKSAVAIVLGISSENPTY